MSKTKDKSPVPEIKVPWFNRFWIKYMVGEAWGSAVDCPRRQLEDRLWQKENMEYYHAIERKMNSVPYLCMVNGFARHEPQKADCFYGPLLPIQTRYPCYSYFRNRMLYVVGFTGLHYFSFVFRDAMDRDDVLGSTILHEPAKKRILQTKAPNWWAGLEMFHLAMDRDLESDVVRRYVLGDDAFLMKRDLESRDEFVRDYCKHNWNRLDDAMRAVCKSDLEWCEKTACDSGVWYASVGKELTIPFERKGGGDAEKRDVDSCSCFDDLDCMD